MMFGMRSTDDCWLSSAASAFIFTAALAAVYPAATVRAVDTVAGAVGCTTAAYLIQESGGAGGLAPAPQCRNAPAERNTLATTPSP